MDPPTAQTPLHIIVIGAGITGLFTSIALATAGHTVTLLERTPHPTPLGAGLQLAPNATRLLTHYSLLPPLAVEPASITTRHWTGRALGRTPCTPHVRQTYGAPLLVAHRADLQGVLLARVRALRDVTLRFGACVEAVDFRGGVRLVGGECARADVVVAADGVGSRVRAEMVRRWGGGGGAVPTGDAAYRVLVPVQRGVVGAGAVRWVGDGKHVVAYAVRGGSLLNVVLVHPARARAPEEPWTAVGSREEMLRRFEGWDPVLRRVLESVQGEQVLEWNLHTHPPLPRWSEGVVTLVGDACHPMLPYVAQGAAQGIEDAASLAAALSLISSKEQVPEAFKTYEAVRKLRAERIQQSALAMQRVLHLPDGPEQRARDEAMARAGEKNARNPDLWADDEWQRFMWGADPVGETVREWRERGRRLGVEGRGKEVARL